MAYSGYLIKIGNYEFPKEYIMYDTYKVIRSVQDLDSYRDSNGVLHRNALSHNLYKVEFQTRVLTNTEYNSIMDNIRSRYTNATERRVSADVFVPETNSYTGSINMYMPDPEIQIIQELSSSLLKYNNVTFKFIGY